MLLVMKFGGTSVGSVEALNKVVEIVKKAKQEGHGLVVVVSAMSGVTNLLLEAAHKAEAGDETFAHQARLEIEQKKGRSRHLRERPVKLLCAECSQRLD